MLNPGTYLQDRYEILGRIGSGGMSVVYKAKCHTLDRLVAIKVLKEEFASDENFVSKFKMEAQAAARLSHPNIVNVYDVVDEGDLHYIVMELIEGITLKNYIEKKGFLENKEAIGIAIQVAQGIAAAHEQHIIHRDIKPQNMIISKDGTVKVADFGIARAVSSQTMNATAVGSVHYISPEQARGGFSDQKSDIYSIGITLYEMVTGQVPFDGDSTVSVAIKHLQEEITPPSEIVPDIPYSLEQIILKCTQKNGERRYRNTGELIQDLKRSLVDPDGDFVVIPPLGNADTVIITDEELDDIRSSYDDEEEFDEYDEDEYGDEEEFDEYDEDDDEYGEYDDDEEYGGKGKKGKSSDDVNPRMKKVMKILTIVVAIIIVFILVFAIGKAAGIFKGGFGIDTVDTDEKTKVKVPNVVGMTEDEAKKTLNKKGLGFKVVAREESKKYEEGTVSKQKTEAGKRVAKNTTIQVVVSSGLVGDEITVPNVSNMSESEAQKALEDAGFEKITSDFAYSDSVAEGDVIGTTPAANARATKDTEIVMKVSKGSEKKTVPNVVGQQDGDAQNAITAAGLTVGTVTYEYYDDVPKGQVVSQTVAGGKKVAPGTSVGLTISSGPKPPEKVSVPPVTGISIEEARALLDGVGLKADIKYDSETVGTVGQVIKCNPGVGTQVDEGSTVTLIVISKSSQPDGGETESTQ